MAEQQRQSLCPRLIDYLAIVGSRSANIKNPGNGQNPPVQVSLFISSRDFIWIVWETFFSNRLKTLSPKKTKDKTCIFPSRKKLKLLHNIDFFFVKHDKHKLVYISWIWCYFNMNRFIFRMLIRIQKHKLQTSQCPDRETWELWIASKSEAN